MLDPSNDIYDISGESFQGLKSIKLLIFELHDILLEL